MLRFMFTLVVTAVLIVMCAFSVWQLLMAYIFEGTPIYHLYGAIMVVAFVIGVGFLGVLWKK